jgi:hypothetical protein
VKGERGGASLHAAPGQLFTVLPQHHGLGAGQRSLTEERPGYDASARGRASPGGARSMVHGRGKHGCSMRPAFLGAPRLRILSCLSAQVPCRTLHPQGPATVVLVVGLRGCGWVWGDGNARGSRRYYATPRTRKSVQFRRRPTVRLCDRGRT